MKIKINKNMDKIKGLCEIAQNELNEIKNDFIVKIEEFESVLLNKILKSIDEIEKEQLKSKLIK